MRSVSWRPALVTAAPCAAGPVEEKQVPVTTPAAAAAEASTAAPHAAIGDFGLDLSAGNPQVKPGDDFFAYANGTWFQHFAIPSDHSSFVHFDKLDELSKESERGIIEQAVAAHAAPGTPEQQIGDYYAAYMDEA